eukprot:TRINITY_DN8431_c0_g1_i2.p1 TRINITY_DN8431_c0_g1~~TRINITY_DN8431_c0_g1_i2.p1  ORF type:complete len:229 (+),score=45.35 TRINITY_DN8431_c0_g1_i2:45-731(+)
MSFLASVASPQQSRVSRMTQYFKRMIQYPQMDLEYTAWQFINICTRPKSVFRTTLYHKQTKNQWARDDPAFVVFLLVFIAVTTCAYAVAFEVGGIGRILHLIFYAIFFDFLVLGIFVSTITWIFANKFLRTQHHHHVEQSVEFLYAFDVHCNSFVTHFLLLYVGQYFLLPLLLQDGFIATFFSNSLYAFSLSYYFYITFLGFEALPFLEKTDKFLYPVVAIVILYIVR